MPFQHPDPRVTAVQHFFETISLASVDRIGAVYAPDARFKDPFNDVQGEAELKRIFTHMFAQVEAPRFVVTGAVAQGDEAFLIWDFTFRSRVTPALNRIHGATHLRFAPDGRVALHRDYWDAAEELYEKLPVVGSLIRFLRRRAAH